MIGVFIIFWVGDLCQGGKFLRNTAERYSRHSQRRRWERENIYTESLLISLSVLTGRTA